MKRKLSLIASMVMALALAFTACATGTPAQTSSASDATAASASAETATPAAVEQSAAPTQEAKDLSGEIIIDGSSTVFPISEAVAEEFRKIHPNVNVPIGIAGTGGGFKKFAAGEIDISDASRPIKDEEKAAAQANGIEFVEFMIAYDGLSVVVNHDNDWADNITVEELKKIWAPDSTVMKWNEVRPEWPAETIGLYGPGTDSGTFDYFTEAINGKAGDTRKDYTPSEDDNVLVQGIAGDKYALGYFGYAYYVENTDKLKVLKVDNGKGAVEPDFETIKNGSYSPLSRPLFIYVSKKALEKEHVKEFVRYYLTEGTKLIGSVGYVPLEESEYPKQLDKIQ